MLDLDQEVCARERIRTKGRDAALHDRLILLGSSRDTVVGYKFREVAARIQIDKTTITSTAERKF